MNVPKLRFKEFSGEWKELKLEDLAEVRTGKAFSSADFNDNGEYLVVTNKNIQDKANGIASVGDRIDIDDDVIIEKYLLSGDNILVTMDGVNIGKTGKYNNEKAVLAQRVGRLNSEQLEFVYQITSSNKFLSEMNKLSVGNAIKHISLKQISDYPFSAPISEEEQEKIGAFFKNIDQKIQFQKEKIHLLKEQKKGLMQKIFSQELRFKDRGDHEYPEWDAKKLNDFAERVIRKNKDLKTNRPLTISAQFGLVDQIEYFNKNVASANLEGYYLLENGEFAYNKSYSNGYPWGAIKRLDKYEHGALSTLYICFSTKNNIHSDFLVHYFDSAEWYKEVSIICVEGARNHGLLNVSVTEFFETLHRLPCLEEQKRISDFLDALNKNIEQNNEKLYLLVKQKNGLMQQMFI